MRIAGPLLSQLGLSAGSRAQSQDTDAIVTFGSVGVVTLEPTEILSAILQPSGQYIETRTSLAIRHEGGFTADSVNPLVRLLEGFWDITIVRGIHVLSSTGDLAAWSKLQWQVENPTSGQFLDTIGPWNTSCISPYSLKFRLMVNSRSPVSFAHHIEAGGGLNTWLAYVTLICNRLA